VNIRNQKMDKVKKKKLFHVVVISLSELWVRKMQEIS